FAGRGLRSSCVLLLCEDLLWGLSHLDTHRTRIESTSPLAAIVVRHTGGRDAAWHGPPGTGAASVPKAHQVLSGTMLLWDHQGSRCPSPTRDALRCTGRGALPVCTCTRHWHGGPRGAVWPRTSGSLVPIPEHRGEQFRRLARIGKINGIFAPVSAGAPRRSPHRPDAVSPLCPATCTCRSARSRGRAARTMYGYGDG